MPEQVGDSADVIDNTDASRFELRADGWLAELAYRVRGELSPSGDVPDLTAIDPQTGCL
jgi:hypothetical protein